MLTQAGTPRTTTRPRVLIVEDDPMLGLDTMKACIDTGLDPTLCLGAGRSGACPALEGGDCPKNCDVEATFVSIVTGPQRVATAHCTQGPLVISGNRPLVGKPTLETLGPVAHVEYPYSPESVATLMLQTVRDDRRRRAWIRLRDRLSTNKIRPW